MEWQFPTNYPVFQLDHGVQGFDQISVSPLSADARATPHQNDSQVLFEADGGRYYGVARVDTTVTPGEIQFEIRRGSDDAVVYSAVVEEFTPTSPPLITTTSLAGGSRNTPYSQTAASEGIAPYQWSISNGTLPPGLTLSARGVLSGTPTQSGNFFFTVKVQDATSASSSRTLSTAIGDATGTSFGLTAGPALTADPGSVVPGGTVTAAWSGLTNPTGRDWIGLYSVGAANGSYQSWVYVNCTKFPGSPIGTGNCQFTAPGSNGTYEFRLLANEGLLLSLRAISLR